MMLMIQGNNHKMLCRQSSSPELYHLIWLHSPGNPSYVNKLSQWLQGLAQLAVCSACKCAALRSQSSSTPAQQICPDGNTSACSSSQPFCCLMPAAPIQLMPSASTLKSGRIKSDGLISRNSHSSFSTQAHSDQAREDTSSEGICCFKT